jgi:hypothetical protein
LEPEEDISGTRDDDDDDDDDVDVDDDNDEKFSEIIRYIYECHTSL